jgi:hypothetical protein
VLFLEAAPPRPPPPVEISPPPRPPPPPETDDEEETRAFWERYPLPGGANQPILVWSSFFVKMSAKNTKMCAKMCKKYKNVCKNVQKKYKNVCKNVQKIQKCVQKCKNGVYAKMIVISLERGAQFASGTAAMVKQRERDCGSRETHGDSYGQTQSARPVSDNALRTRNE